MNESTDKKGGRMSADAVSRLMGSLNERFYEETEQKLAARQAEAFTGKGKTRSASFLNSGWFAACICAVVGIGVYVALLGLGRGWFDTSVGTSGMTQTASESEDGTGDTSVGSQGLHYVLTTGGWTVKDIGKCTDENLVIPETYLDGPVVGIADQAFEGNTSIRSVSLPSSVIKIGCNAFYGCTNLVSLQLPQNNKTSIGDAAFSHCKSLIEVYLYNGTTCRPSVFEYDTGLVSIRFPADMTEITDRICNECSALSEVILPPGLTVIHHAAFGRCASLCELTLPDTLRSVDNSAFAGCGLDLETIRLPESLIYIGEGAFDTLTLVPGYAVDGETGKAYLEDGSPLGSYELYVDNVLIYVYTNEETYTVREGTRMIAEGAITMYPEWKGVKTVILPDSIEYLCGEVTSVGGFGNGLFNVVGEWEKLPVTAMYPPVEPDDPYGSTEVETFPRYIGNEPCTHASTEAQIKSTREANCFGPSLTYWNCPVCNKKWGVYGDEILEHEFVDGVCTHCGLNEDADTFFEFFFDSKAKTLTITRLTEAYKQVKNEKDTIILPNVWGYEGQPYPVTELRGALNQNSSIKTVIIPEGYTHISENAFYRDSNLKTVVLPSTVCHIGEAAFRECTSLEEIDLPSSLTWIADDTFNFCTNLKRVRIADNVTGIGQYAFSHTAITELTIPSSVTRFTLRAVDYTKIRELIIPDSVTYLSGELAQCPALEVIRLPAGFKQIQGISNLPALKSINIPLGAISVSPNTLEGCDALEEIVVPADHPVFELRDGMLIQRDKKMVVAVLNSVEELIIPDDGSITKIAAGACAKRRNLKRLVVPGTVTCIDGSAFRNCTGLESVELSEGLVKMGTECFYGCTALTSFVIPDSVSTVGGQILAECRGLRELEFGIRIQNEYSTRMDWIFHNCTSLETIRFHGSMVQWTLTAQSTHLADDVRSGVTVICTNGSITLE